MLQLTPIQVHGILGLAEAGLKPASTAIVRRGLPEIAQFMQEESTATGSYV